MASMRPAVLARVLYGIKPALAAMFVERICASYCRAELPWL